MSLEPEKNCALLREILTAKVPPPIPADLPDDSEFAHLYAELLELRRIVMAIAGGDLSVKTPLKGYTAGALKTLQANLKHMTWQTQMIATGDFSQRLDFMGEFSKAFNSMTTQLEESLRTVKENKEELRLTNAGLQVEIERREQAQAALTEREAHYRNLTETMKDVVWILDASTLRFTYVSPSVQRLRGFTPEEIMSQPLDAALAPGEAKRLKQIIKANLDDFLAGKIDENTYLTSEVEQVHKDGSSVWTEAIVRYVRSDRTGAMEIHGVTRDISERRDLRLELERQATTDSLTGVANRRHFLNSVLKEIKRCERHGCTLSLLMLDIDHFKAVNDTFGHAMGDSTLKAFAQTCQEELRTSDLFGRIGGEEFALLLMETDMETACTVAERIRARVEKMELFTKDARPVHITTSIGVAELRLKAETVSDLMIRADQALYNAKNLGRNRVECLK
ncbi:diguanylate cyclase (GGDEF)-like protein/PAS domain S-box-containing protein [Desulfomicrobium macestii]|uniref:diguanylate cyclase n=2 Tax=Desulfomicrobium TaxID=898 RepID=A0A8G2C5L7_DESNO|nr:MULTISPECIES: diguanylate cyclase [Desulfomicrobium]MBE1427067.1 diguanylate cyclase (GGDEF)-like protein/PAS domain S-box-containing protein [Desulfomicrobium macestii]SFM12911.1 PAS domain S-box-containing protein/diguanylate cyclase (GGDEF) domain-containing protein [Desulfomicrobium norvegicum]